MRTLDVVKEMKRVVRAVGRHTPLENGSRGGKIIRDNGLIETCSGLGTARHLPTMSNANGQDIKLRVERRQRQKPLTRSEIVVFIII